MLQSRGIQVEPVEFCDQALTVFKQQVSVGATPEYLRGFYFIQDAASLLPVLALQPKPGERVLDMAAAPGGKTTHICELMRNVGVLVANDVATGRLPALQSNLSRMGCYNVAVISYDGT